MSADVVTFRAGQAAWEIAEHNGVVTETIARQALVYAAERTAADPDWLTDRNWVTIHMRLMHAAIPAHERRLRWALLVAHVPFGPAMQACLDQLVRP
jgi:hypothetical protein